MQGVPWNRLLSTLTENLPMYTGCPKNSESVKTDFITVQSFHEYKYENVCMYVICIYVFMNEWIYL